MPSVLAPKRPPEDAWLLSRCVKGEAAAWRELILRYQKLIYSVARSHFRQASIADDVFQEVCLELYDRLDSLRDPQALPAWLLTVTRRKCARALKDRLQWADMDAGNVRIMDQKIPQIENRFWIERVLAELPERDRSLIEALYFDPDQPSYSEIARRLNMPVASIGPTRARCLEKLRKRWKRNT